jgi:hypothetical protein
MYKTVNTYFNTLFLQQNSGAYIFRPENQEPESTSLTSVDQVSGEHVTEWRVALDIDWASYVVRKYDTDEHVEVEWLVGPIPSKTSEH